MISIIIPLFNKQDTIKKTLDSIVAQDFQNYEVIIVDDGSTDNSVSVVENYLSDRFLLVKKTNGGPSSARNMGVKAAHGDWIVFLDADDCFEPGALKLFNELILKHPACDIFCCNFFVDDGDGKRLYSKHYKMGYLCNNFLAWSTDCFMPRAGTVLYRKNLLLRYSYNEKIRRYEDAEALFEMMRTNKIFTCPIPVMTYCRFDSQASRPCDNISHDFIGHLCMDGKGMWEQYALAELYKEGVYLYPDQIHKLYRKQDIRTLKVKIAGMIIKLLKLLYR